MPRITLAGEDLIAQKQAAQQPLNITRFIFANVPGLNPSDEVDRAAPKPPAGQIVYSAEIPAENKGYVNPSQVVYSLQVGSDIGDWDFNWIGLESAEGVLFAVAYMPLQQKRRNIPPLQIGNNITRNFLVVFDGAQALTGVTIDASTWQHDFTVRLAGIDERERQSNRDIFGRACFFGSALQLEKVGDTYQLKPGTAYIEGVRIQRAAALPVAPPALPTTAWLDVALQRELNDVVATWSVAWGAGKVDYVDSAGVQHYCVAIAQLPDSNTITDSRPVENIAGPLVAHFQPKDQTLSALAGLETSADKMIYATGSDEFATAELTEKARELLGLTSPMQMRALLELVKQTSTTDTTAGAIAIVGMFGWGSTASVSLPGGNLDSLSIPSGSYRVLTVHTGIKPQGYTDGVVTVERYNATDSIQIFKHIAGQRKFFRASAGGVWSPWAEDWTSGNFTPSDLAPPGKISLFARSTAPNGWLKNNGAEVSRTAYASLFAAIGTTFGAGNGTTTFNLPDDRGDFHRSWDDGRGVDAGRLLGSFQTDSIRAHAHELNIIRNNALGGAYAESASGDGDQIPSQTEMFGGIETRPRNIAYLSCIKY